MLVELGPFQTGREASYGGNVLLSILLMRIITREFVVSLGFGLRFDSIFTINAELTAEKRPA